MPPLIRNIVLLLVSCGGIIPAAADESSTATEYAYDFSVLTPGLESKFSVSTGFDLTFLGITSLVDKGRSKALRILVESEGYNPDRPIADAILAAMSDAGRTGTNEPIARRPASHFQSLAPDDLPPDPKGAVLLDITINWIGLFANATGNKLRPAFILTWRLISPDGKLIAPGRELRYIHEPVHKKLDVVDPALHPRGAAAPAALQPNPSTQVFCSIGSVNAAQKEPAALWECFDEAYLAAARKLVEQLPKRR